MSVHCSTLSLRHLGAVTTQKSKYEYRDHLVGCTVLHTILPLSTTQPSCLLDKSYKLVKHGCVVKVDKV